jgi:hypothetical protein
MQRSDTGQPDLRSQAQQRTLRLAWATLLGFFAAFLALLAWAAYSSRQYYLAATDVRDATLIVRGPAEWIAWQPAARSVFQGIRDQQAIGEGDSVRVVTKAGYGQIASIRLFDQSQLDLWAGADMRIETLQTTRWSDRLQAVTIRQSGGYVRYDLKAGQPYRQVRFQVLAGDVVLDLAPGGSYSVDLRAKPGLNQAPAGTRLQPFSIDVAVRSGSVSVVGPSAAPLALGAHQRVEIDPSGRPGLPVPARWELIRDGGFSQFTEEAYNNTTMRNQPALLRANTWEVYGTPPLPIEQRGFFRLSSICRPPMIGSCAGAERRAAAWFYRAGGQTSGFTTGIRQQLGLDGSGVDISEYRVLSFSLWVRVIEQSLEDVGDRGTECPVMIRVLARKQSPDDPDEERVVCIYTDANDRPPQVKADDVIYRQVPKAGWTHFDFDLRAAEWLPQYRYLQGLQIYANGHDYNALVSDVSLIGEQ